VIGGERFAFEFCGLVGFVKFAVVIARSTVTDGAAEAAAGFVGFGTKLVGLKPGSVSL
jgi:hypothetical protein